MMRRIPLRFAIPGVIFGFGLIMAVFSFLFESRLAGRRMEWNLTQHLLFLGNLGAETAENLLANSDLEGLGRQINRLAADPYLRLAAVCEEGGTILLASRFEYRGRKMEETEFKEFASSIQALTRARTEVSGDKRRLTGLFPFLFPPKPGELVSSARGCLLLQYDLAYPRELATAGVRTRSTVVAILLVCLCIATAIFFHRILTRRIAALISATQRLAAGDLQASAELHGHDELADLSRSFDHMAGEVRRQTSALRLANKQMAAEMAERQHVQKELANSELRFRSVWENSADAMRLTDARGVILWVNPAYCELSGLEEKLLVGRPFPETHRPGSYDPDLLSRYRQRLAEGSVARRVQRKVSFLNGKTAEVEMANSLINMDGGERLMLSVFRDVSDRVRAHEELRVAKEFSENLIRTANLVIVGLDRSGNVTLFNQTAERVSGCPREEVLGQDWFERFIPAEDFSLRKAEFQNILVEGTPNACEFPILTRRGSKRIISWQTNQVREEGKVGGIIFFGVDRTEKLEEEEERRAFERKLQETQKLESLGVLAGGVAHDFNNLLTAILGNANLASLELPKDCPQRGYVQSIESTAVRAADLCRQMLAYSGRGRFVVQSVELNGLVRGMQDLLAISVPKKVEIVYELEEGILPRMVADATQLRQVLLNLVINASEAIGDRQGAIVVRTGLQRADRAYLSQAVLSPDLPEGDYVFLEVRDTGCGMDKATQAKIFDPFFSTKFTGRGLGLAVVLGIVRGHRGSLLLESELGNGSCFRVLLPCSDGMLEGVVAEGTDGAEDWKAHGTVLVADDDPAVRTFCTRALETLGFTVLQAGDGAEAVRIFRERHKEIQLTLLDLTMPRLGGLEALSTIRSDFPEARVILTSAYDEEHTLRGITGCKVDAFLQKPFKLADLAAKLRDVLARG